MLQRITLVPNLPLPEARRLRKHRYGSMDWNARIRRLIGRPGALVWVVTVVHWIMMMMGPQQQQQLVVQASCLPVGDPNGTDIEHPTWQEFVNVLQEGFPRRTRTFHIVGDNCPQTPDEGRVRLTGAPSFSCCDFNGGIDDECIIECEHAQIIVPNGAFLDFFSYTIRNTNDSFVIVEPGGFFGGLRLNFENNGNETNVQGGAIQVAAGGEVDLQNVWFINNTATNGGGIYSNGTVSARGCFFSGNEATQAGGAIQSWGELNLEGDGTTFANNIAGTEGGAIQCYGNTSIVDNEFVRNTAQYGGAIHAPGMNGTNIQDSIFRENVALLKGPAILEGSKGVVMRMGNVGCDNQINPNGLTGGPASSVCDGIMNEDQTDVSCGLFSDGCSEAPSLAPSGFPT